MAAHTVVQEEWDADHERRKTQGQVGWKNLNAPDIAWWSLTRFNSKAFDDAPHVVPVYTCGCCKGNGVQIAERGEK